MKSNEIISSLDNNAVIVCDDCGKVLTTDEVRFVLEKTADIYEVRFCCNGCGYYSDFNISNDENILREVPLRKFISIHYQRLQCCAGCEVRSYTMEYDGVDGCKCMDEFMKTGKCEQRPEIDVYYGVNL